MNEYVSLFLYKLLMNRILFYCCLLISTLAFAQNIQVDSQSFTPQQLIEDILIDSNCISNINVTNVIGGNFNNTDQSYGYFDATGTTFPFQSGIVLSTGRLINTQGPNTSLSDDDAVGWVGDTDLETVLNEPNTLNATIIEFDFTSVATQVSFRYIFASEEYQFGNPNTCQYSDLFGFLIRPVNQVQYTNIALVPNTQTPVKVTTVHPEIPNGCPAQNEAYFGSWNGSVSPINFNGQTAILTATADLIPNQTYHVKLVIADEQNYRYDSAVFLEAGSFKLSTDLGPDRLFLNNSAICENDTYILDATQPGNNAYKWFKDGNEIFGEINATYEVFDAGNYSVEVTLDNNCLSYGDAKIEYSTNPTINNAVLAECDLNQDGFTTYNLFDAIPDLINNDPSLAVSNFYLTNNDATNATNAILNATNFQNSVPNQVVYARIENDNRCFSIAQLQLMISNNTVQIQDAESCDGSVIDGFAEFNLNAITASFQNQIPNNATVTYYINESDAFNETNSLNTPFQNTEVNSQTIFVKITSNNQCYAISTVKLNVLYTPVLLIDESIFYCLNSFPQTIRLYGGVQNDSPSNYYYEWLFNGMSTAINTSFNDVNEAGIYTVIVTHPNGCSVSRNITVTASNSASIDSIKVEEASSNNSIRIEVSGEGNYEFSLDNINGFYQDSNEFFNVFPGFHTIYVKDKNGCGITEQIVSVLGFPKYFTPNGDGFHDTWRVYGVSSNFNQDISVKIFNRYGKLLVVQNNLSPAWDGTLKGSALPSDDYWFLITFEDGRTYNGHFTLKR
jgi:gliding motility-associated-like protein